MKTIAFATLGCKVNQAETESLARRFAAAGYRLADFDALADVYILNTCTVTHIADRKGRQLLRQARRRNPVALVVAAGCYATTDAAALQKVEGVDLVVGNAQKENLLALIEEAQRSRGAGEQGSTGARGMGGEAASPALLRSSAPLHRRTRSFVKVQDGCDNFCAYCIVPYARGKPRSVSPEQVVAQVQSLAQAGYQEVVLTGVHLGLYGRGAGEQGSGGAEARQESLPISAAPLPLCSLVQAILSQTTIPRLRLSSLEPQDFEPGLLALWQDRRLCRHLHLPLQSGCDATLCRMGRRYTAAGFAELVAQARAAIPGLAVTVDMIVGLPGESAAEFQESYQFAQAMGFAHIHVFPYSARRGTRAVAMPNQVPEPVKQERSQALLKLSAESGRAFRAGFVGQVMEVLWEGADRRLDQDKSTHPLRTWVGLTDNYIRVTLESAEDLSNRLTAVRLEAVT